MGGGRSGKFFHSEFEQIISLENLFLAWREFKRGKTSKLEVQKFEFNLEDNLFELHEELKSKTFQPKDYVSFYVRDPKLRHIHKADIRDRIVHQAVFRVLYHLFDNKFIYDSYSCRFDKGTHKGVLRLIQFARKASANYGYATYALKCDIKKFFENIDHKILLGLITNIIKDEDAIWLIKKIISSFESKPNKGLPLGNVTSQLFANIYLNELDQFIKHKLKEKYYIRYCDDFVILNRSKEYLRTNIYLIQKFLSKVLELHLHREKILIRKIRQGIDFLGYVVLPHHIVLRTKTKRRILKKVELRKSQLGKDLITEESFNQTIQSYLGILKHCRGYKIKKDIDSIILSKKR